MVAIYLDAMYDKKLKMAISYAIDLVFSTLGYSYKIIYNLSLLNRYDFLIWYDSKNIKSKSIANSCFQIPAILIRFDEELFIPNQIHGGIFSSRVKTFKTNKTEFKILTKNTELQPIEIVKSKNNNSSIVAFNFDIFGNIYYHISDYVEQTNKLNSNKIDVESSFEKYYHEPLVNSFCSLLEDCMKLNCAEKKVTFFKKEQWPKGENFALAFTHTVDNLTKWESGNFTNFLFDAIKLFFTFRGKGLFRQLGSYLKWMTSDVEPYWKFEDYFKLEEDYGISSTWFISTLDDDVYNYKIENDSDLNVEIDNINRHGHEFAALLSQKDIDQTKLRLSQDKIKKKTNSDIIGVRFDDNQILERTMSEYHKKTLLYDCSLSSNKSDMFYKGINTPFNKIIDSIKIYTYEVPVTFKARYLRISRYQSLTYEAAKQEIDYLIKTVSYNNGMLCFDFEMSSMQEIPYLSNLYKYLLESIKSQNYYNTNIKDLVLWWKARKQVLVSNEEWGCSVQFLDNFSYFSLRKFGNKEIKEIKGVDYSIQGKNNDLIVLSNIKAHDVAEIIFKAEKKKKRKYISEKDQSTKE